MQSNSIVLDDLCCCDFHKSIATLSQIKESKLIHQAGYTTVPLSSVGVRFVAPTETNLL